MVFLLCLENESVGKVIVLRETDLSDLSEGYRFLLPFCQSEILGKRIYLIYLKAIAFCCSSVNQRN